MNKKSAEREEREGKQVQEVETENKRCLLEGVTTTNSAVGQ